MINLFGYIHKCNNLYRINKGQIITFNDTKTKFRERWFKRNTKENNLLKRVKTINNEYD